MYKKAQELGIEYIATGHYAKTEYSEIYNRYVLKKAVALGKDQTYVLYNIPKELIEKVKFPLGNFTSKEETREIAKKNGLTIADKPDSQEICFIPDNDYVGFLKKNNIMNQKAGNIVDTNGKILGKHEGLYKYTIGQRRGMGISNENKLYVVRLNKETNELVVGTEEDLYSKELTVTDVNLLLLDNIEKPTKVQVKIRYSAKEAEGNLYVIDENTYKIEFEKPQRAITPGQSAVFYIDNMVVGGGRII
jgi:tRNA-specific 2-thiouridylase